MHTPEPVASGLFTLPLHLLTRWLYTPGDNDAFRIPYRVTTLPWDNTSKMGTSKTALSDAVLLHPYVSVLPACLIPHTSPRKCLVENGPSTPEHPGRWMNLTPSCRPGLGVIIRSTTLGQRLSMKLGTGLVSQLATSPHGIASLEVKCSAVIVSHIASYKEYTSYSGHHACRASAYL